VGDDPTPGEVSRSLNDLRHDLRDDLQDIRLTIRDGHQELSRRLDKVVATDVYEADRRADQERYKLLDAQIKTMQNAKNDRAANRKWVIAAVLIPLGVALLEVYFTFKGVR
jgi:hypothetical protein